VGFQDEFALRLVLHELEGPETDGLQLEAIAQFLISLAAHDHAAVVVRDKAQ
jgi:hypothetical protein